MRAARPKTFFAAIAVAGMTLAASAFPAGTSASTTTLTFVPVADAYVKTTTSAKNYGSSGNLYTDGSPVVLSYVRFSPSGLGGSTVTRATLRVYANTAGASGQSYEVHTAGSAWDESTITAANAPSFGPAIGSFGPIAAGTWTSVDVTSAVQGDGPVTFVLSTAGSTNIRYGSRESATPPQLVVESQPQATGTAPVNTALPTISGTARQGQTLTASTGSWSGTTPIGYSYQWRRCDSGGNNCSSISGATAQSYLLASGDVGATIRVVVTATNSAGSASATSAQTAVVQAQAVVGPCGAGSSPPARWAHVIWIVMENHSYSQVIGSSAAPYENQLASQCGLATNYKGITHPSLPNYIAMTSGDTQGITDDNGPSSHPLSAASIFSQVKGAGQTWRSYEESMPSTCALSSSGTYAVKHNPAAYYVPIRTDCVLWDIPMGTTTSGAFASDLANNTLPSFSFITPNLCNDTHDCSVATGDAWLQSWIPKITASPAYQSGNTALFLTWDEDDFTSVNQVATIVVSPTTPAATRSSTAFNHYSLLKTTEQMLGLTSFLGHANDPATTSMRTDFHL